MLAREDFTSTPYSCLESSAKLTSIECLLVVCIVQGPQYVHCPVVEAVGSSCVLVNSHSGSNEVFEVYEGQSHVGVLYKAQQDVVRLNICLTELRFLVPFRLTAFPMSRL